MALDGRRILVLTAGMAGVALALVYWPLYGRPSTPSQGILPIERAAGAGVLPRGLVLMPCHRPGPDDLFMGSALREAFHAAQPSPVRAGATVHPSFQSPWAVQLFDREGRSYIAVVDFDPVAWASHAEAPPGERATLPAPVARRAEQEVSQDTARHFEALWQTSIGAALQHDDYGLDGTTYFFDDGHRCARAWSPPKGSRNAMLASLLAEIREGMDEDALQKSLSGIPAPARGIPWPPTPEEFESSRD